MELPERISIIRFLWKVVFLKFTIQEFMFPCFQPIEISTVTDIAFWNVVVSGKG